MKTCVRLFEQYFGYVVKLNFIILLLCLIQLETKAQCPTTQQHANGNPEDSTTCTAATQKTSVFTTVPVPVQVTFAGGFVNGSFYTIIGGDETAIGVCNHSLSQTMTVTFSEPVSDVDLRIRAHEGEDIFDNKLPTEGFITDNFGNVRLLGDQVFLGTGITQLTITATSSRFWFIEIVGVFFTPKPPTSPKAGNFGILVPPSSDLITSASPGDSLLLSGNFWVNPNLNPYQIFFDNTLVAQQFRANCLDQPFVSFDIPCGATLGIHTITCKIGTVSTTVNFTVVVPPSGISPLTPCQTGSIQSIALAQVNSPLTDNNILVNGMGTLQKIGKKIFPDKETPTDRDNKRLIKVSVQTSGFLVGTPIYFRSFDPDDRSTDDPLVDCTNDQGNDNRGQNDQFYADSIGMTPATSVNTDAAGLAVVYFAVTTFAGDNFIIAASADQQYLNTVAVDAQQGSVNFGIGLRDGNGMGNALPNKSVVVSEMITVWRRFHVEVDTMGKVRDNLRASPPVPENNAKGMITTIEVNTDPLYPNTTKINSIFTVSGGASLEPRRFELGVIRITGIPNIAGSISVLTNETNSIIIARNVQLENFQINPQQLPSFVMVDDDDFNNNNNSLVTLRGDSAEQVTVLSDTFDLMKSVDDPIQNVFAPAFMIPIFDGAGKTTNNDNNIQFFLNVPSSTNLPFAAINTKRDATNSESDDYWVVYLLIGYQSGEPDDFDPNDGAVVGGVSPRVVNCQFCISDIIPTSCGSLPPVPKGSDGSLVFVETMRDFDANVDRTIFPNPDFRTRSVPHEVGHQMGLAGDKQNFGIMTGDEPPKFAPSHINILRWRVKSPGQ
jgi:hypothetical protein